MSRAIISYDDTVNDRDALALGRLFSDAGVELSLAYVRHAASDALEEVEADGMLERGARSIGFPNASRHVIVNASTGVGLAELAAREDADVVVFGSDYRTSPGSVQPGTSAQRLLDGGPAAVAIAPAGLSSRGSLAVKRIGVLAEGGDNAPELTARSLAESLGASVISPGDGSVDLLIVGSRPEAPNGRVSISARAAYSIETSGVPVLVVSRGVAISFKTRVLTHA